MKSKFTIIVTTKDMQPIYDTDNPSKHTDDHNIMITVEREIHKAIEMIVRQYLTIDNLNESILNNYIVDYEVTPVDGIEDLGEFGNIKIFLKKDDKKVKLVDIKKIQMELQEPLPEEER